MVSFTLVKLPLLGVCSESGEVFLFVTDQYQHDGQICYRHDHAARIGVAAQHGADREMCPELCSDHPHRGLTFNPGEFTWKPPCLEKEAHWGQAQSRGGREERWPSRMRAPTDLSPSKHVATKPPPRVAYHLESSSVYRL